MTLSRRLRLPVLSLICAFAAFPDAAGAAGRVRGEFASPGDEATRGQVEMFYVLGGLMIQVGITDLDPGWYHLYILPSSPCAEDAKNAQEKPAETKDAVPAPAGAAEPPDEADPILLGELLADDLRFGYFEVIHPSLQIRGSASLVGRSLAVYPGQAPDAEQHGPPPGTPPIACAPLTPVEKKTPDSE